MKLCYLFIFFVLSTISQAQKNWELTKDKNNIQVYIKDFSIGKQKTVKAVTTIPVSLQTIYAVFNDGTYSQNWVANVIESSQLKVMTDKSKYLYFVLNMPFPLKKRDIILHEHFDQHKKTKTLKVNSIAVPDYIPEKEGIARINEAAIIWIFIPKKNGMVEINYQFYIDQTGIPGIEIHSFMVESVYKTIQNLLLELEKEKFKNQKFKNIKE